MKKEAEMKRQNEEVEMKRQNEEAEIKRQQEEAELREKQRAEKLALLAEEEETKREAERQKKIRLLLEFDANTSYGPFLGSSKQQRRQRWEVAWNMNKNPPGKIWYILCNLHED
jgi:hypothetical protein